MAWQSDRVSILFGVADNAAALADLCSEHAVTHKMTVSMFDGSPDTTVTECELGGHWQGGNTTIRRKRGNANRLGIHRFFFLFQHAHYHTMISGNWNFEASGATSEHLFRSIPVCGLM